MTLNQTAQDFQDDIEMWGHLPATITVPGTDFKWTPEEFRVALAALRDFYQHGAQRDLAEAWREGYQAGYENGYDGLYGRADNLYD